MTRNEIDGGMKAEIPQELISFHGRRKGTLETRKRAVRARRSRRELIREMGGACWNCADTHELCCHHVHEPTWNPARKSYQARTSEYWRAWRAGELALLCKDCHDAMPSRLRRELAEHCEFLRSIYSKAPSRR